MESLAACIPEYLRTLLIILRSNTKLFVVVFVLTSATICRVLIATVRDNKALCPCIRCTIPKEKIPGLSTKSDSEICQHQAHNDMPELRSKVDTARKIININGYVVNSARVDDLLK